jgi:hypothetical protein
MATQDLEDRDGQLGQGDMANHRQVGPALAGRQPGELSRFAE